MKNVRIVSIMALIALIFSGFAYSQNCNVEPLEATEYSLLSNN